MKLGWVYDRQFLDHDTGNVHVDQPKRLRVIVRSVREAGLWDQLEPLDFGPAGPETLALVHEPAYVDVVRMMSDGGFSFIGSPDTCLSPRSYDVAALATGGVVAACDAVAAGPLCRAFCAVRPPGHHAEVDEAKGFCLFNHVAVAAEHLVRQRGFSRVAIVDLDAHHGNGTQHFFEGRREVLYVSLHESGGYPGTGAASEVGRDAGAGLTLNVPLAPGSGSPQYRDALERAVLPALQRFAPEFLLLSTGFDALPWDRTSRLALEPEAYRPLTERLVEVAERSARGRVVSVLEGGYDLGNLGRAAVAHVRGLLRRARRECEMP